MLVELEKSGRDQQLQIIMKIGMKGGSFYP